jgi:hypothetical protein
MAVSVSRPVGPRGEEASRRAAWPALTAGIVVAVLVILVAGRSTTFLGDEWGWIFAALHPTSATFLNPDNGHLMASTHAYYAVMARLFGLGQYVLYQVGALALHLVVAGLVFVLARRRVGATGAVVAAGLVALLGTGADAFLTAINIGLLAATAAGLGALVLLDRDTRATDAAACVLLIVALASWTSAVALTAGVLVELAWRRRWDRLWLAVLPAVLYVAWRLHWAGGLFSDIGVSGAPKPGVVAVIGHAIQAAAGAVAGVVGVQLMSPTLRAHLPWLGTAAAIVVVAGVAGLAGWWLRFRRRGGPGVPPRLAGLLVAAGVFWLLVGVARGTLGDTYASRYVYVGAVLVILIVVEVMPAAALHGRLARVLAALAALSVALNLVWMVVWGNHLRSESTIARAQLAALEISGSRVGPAFAPSPSEFALADVTKERYLAAVGRFGGRPAYSLAQLTRAPEPAREAADGVLGRARAPRLAPRARPASATCLGLLSGSGSGALTFMGHGSRGVISVPAQGSVLVLARRFADRFTVGVGGLRAGQAATVVAPPASTAQPWAFKAFYSGGARVCPEG